MNAEHFRDRAIVLISGLRERFLELEARDFPASTPGEVIKHLCEILALIESKLSAADERTLRLVIKLIFEYQKLLSLFDNAHSEQTPRGLVRVLEDLLIHRKIHEGPCKLIAAPRTNYNYSIHDLTDNIYQAVINLLTKDELVKIQKNEPIFLIAFPRIERDTTLLHPVFGHEVGHLIAFQFLQEAVNRSDFATALNTAFEPIASKIQKEKKGDEVALVTDLQRAEEMLRQYWYRGLEELVSDYVGLLLFGPSALFASDAVFSQQELDRMPRHPDYYPPSRYRLRFGLEALKAEGFVDAFVELAKLTNGLNAFPAVEQWFRDMAQLTSENDDLSRLEQDEVQSAAYRWIKDSLPTAMKYAKEKIKAIVYTNDLMKKEVPELVERISLELPPNEIGTVDNMQPVSWASAFVAGWCYVIYGKTRKNERISLKEYQRVNQLTLRAVEAILLQERYRAEAGAIT